MTITSDVDIVVSFIGEYDLLDVIGLKQALENTLRLLIDVVAYETLCNNDFAYSLLADEKMIDMLDQSVFMTDKECIIIDRKSLSDWAKLPFPFHL